MANKDPFKSAYSEQIAALVQKAQDNTANFKYDPMTDVSYQALAKEYARLGDRANENTLANQAALTGGRASSYAVSAAAQAQNQYNQALTDKIPELERLAYDRFNADRNYGLNLLGTMKSLDDSAYSRFTDQRNFDYQQGRDNVADSHWDKTFDYQKQRDNVADSHWDKNFDYQKQRDNVSDSHWERNFNYQQGRDSVSDSHWEREYQLKKDSASRAGRRSGGGRRGRKGRKGRGGSYQEQSTQVVSYVPSVAAQIAQNAVKGILTGKVKKGKSVKSQTYKKAARMGYAPIAFRRNTPAEARAAARKAVRRIIYGDNKHYVSKDPVRRANDIFNNTQMAGINNNSDRRALYALKGLIESKKSDLLNAAWTVTSTPTLDPKSMHQDLKRYSDLGYIKNGMLDADKLSKDARDAFSGFYKYVEKTRQKAEALNYMAKEAGIYKTELQYDTKAGKFKRKLYLKDNKGNEPREGVIEKPSAGQKFAIDIAQGTLGFLADLAVGKFTGVGILPVMGVNAFGQGAGDARAAGAGIYSQWGAGLTNAGINVGTEKMWSTSNIMRNSTGRGLLDNSAEKFANKMAARFAKGTAADEIRYKAIKLGLAASSEGVEEFMNAILQPISDRFYDPDAFKKIAENPTGYLADAVYQGIVGTAIGGIVGGPSGVNMNIELSAEDKEKILQAGLAMSEKSSANNFARSIDKNRLKGGKVLNNAILDLKHKIESGRELTEHDQVLLSAAKKSRIRGAENVSGSFIIRSEEGLNTEYDREKASVLLTQKVANREKEVRKYLQDADTPKKTIDELSFPVARILEGTGSSADVENVLFTVDNNPALELIQNETTQDLNVGMLPRMNNGMIMGGARETQHFKKELNSFMGARYESNVEEILPKAKDAAKKEMLASIGMETNPEIEKLFDEGAKNVKEGEEFINYAHAFNYFYDSGRRGLDYKNLDKAIFQSELVPADIRKKIYEIGKAEREDNNIITNKSKLPIGFKAGRVTLGENVSMSNSMINAYRTLAKSFGVEISLEENIKDSEDKEVNGYYKNGTIHISMKSDSPVVDVLKHEVTHHIQVNSPRQYAAFKKYVLDEFYNSNLAEYENKLNKYMNDYKDISRAEAEDELLADATDVFWKGDADAEAAVKTLVEKNRSLGETILKAIKSTVDKLNTLSKNVINALKGEYRGKWLEELGILEKAQEMWTNALMNPEIDKFEEAVNNDDEIKFMYKGKDSEGRDVFSISSKTKKLTKKEKRTELTERFKNGEVLTVEFDNGKGRKYTAKPHEDFAGKNFYGDKQTKSINAFNKKVNLFYEGDLSKLLQNSEYIRPGDEKKEHKNVIKWEYYKKEIVIGETPYKLLINVQNRTDGDFIYNIKFEKIKKDQHWQAINEDSKNNAHVGIDSVNLSQNNEEVKEKYQRKNSIFDIPNNQQADSNTVRQLNKKIDALILNQTKTKGTIPKRSSVVSYLKELITEVGSDVKAEDLRIDYHNLYKAAKSGDDATKERLLNEITREIVKNTYETNRISPEIRDVQRYLKNMTISIDEDLEAEIKNRYGTFGKFKDYIDGAFKIKLNKNIDRMEYVVPVDDMLSEMNELFGDTIKVDGRSLDDVTDFVTALATIAEYASVKDNKVYLFDGGANLTQYTEKEIAEYEDELIKDVKANLEASLGEIKPIVTYADKQEAKISKLKASMKRSAMDKPEQAKSKKLINKLINDTGSKMPAEDAMRIYEEVWSAVHQATPNASAAYSAAARLSNALLNSNENNIKENLQTKKQVIDLLSVGKIYISPELAKKLNYQELKARYGHALRFTTDINSEHTMPAELVYDFFQNKLGEKYPELFASDAADAEEAVKNLCNAVDMVETSAETDGLINGEYKNVASDITELILDNAISMKPEMTYADKQQEKLKAAVKEARNKIKERETIKRQKAEKKHEEEIAEKDKAIEELESAIKEERESVSELKRDLRKERSELNRKSKAINSIKWYSNKLSNKLLKPTNTQFMPEEFRKSIAKVLSEMDFSTDRGDAFYETHGYNKTYENFMELKNEYRKVLEEKNDGDSTFSFVEDEDFMNQIDSVLESLKESRLVDMDADTIESVRDVIRGLDSIINKHNDMLKYDQYKTISGTGNAVINELSKKAEKNRYAGGASAVSKFIFSRNINPADRFAVLGGTLNKLFKEITIGFDDHAMNVKSAQNEFQRIQETVGEDAFNTIWEDSKVESFKLESGKTLNLTHGQMVTLFLLSERKQALEHILTGGIQTAEVKPKKLGKNTVLRKSSMQREKITHSDIINIVKSLSPEEIKCAKMIQHYLNTTVSDWGNEVSMKVWGYNKFTEENYFPIKIARETVDANVEEAAVTKIINPGFAKKTKPSAKNAVVLDNVLSVASNHISAMSAYQALSMPLQDLENVWNYRGYGEDGVIKGSVREAIERAYGREANEYIERFLKDVNGNIAKSEMPITTKIIGTAKRAAIAANGRVAMQQPMSIVRASAVINPKYLARSKYSRDAVKEMQQHSGVAVWKDLGYYSTDVGPSLTNAMINKENKLEKVTLDMYGFLDNMTWGKIWGACKLKVEDTMNIHEGDEGYWQAVNEQFREVVYRTQVFDSVLSRSELMRQKDVGSSVLTAFLSEPTKTLSLFITNTQIAKQMYDEGNVSEARKLVAKQFGWFVTSATAMAVMKSVYDAAIRHIADDDKKDKNIVERFFDALLGENKLHTDGNLFGELNPIAMLPVGKDIQSALQGYTPSRLDMSLFVKISDAYKACIDPKNSLVTKLEKVANAAGVFFGLPVDIVYRDLKGSFVYLASIHDFFTGANTKQDLLMDFSKIEKTYKGNKGYFKSVATDSEKYDSETREKAAKYILENDKEYTREKIDKETINRIKRNHNDEMDNFIKKGKNEEAEKLAKSLAARNSMLDAEEYLQMRINKVKTDQLKKIENALMKGNVEEAEKFANKFNKMNIEVQGERYTSEVAMEKSKEWIRKEYLKEVVNGLKTQNNLKVEKQLAKIERIDPTNTDFQREEVLYSAKQSIRYSYYPYINKALARGDVETARVYAQKIEALYPGDRKYTADAVIKRSYKYATRNKRKKKRR
jgi:phage protein